MPKRALITGVTGQDGSYLAEFLLAKGYESMASSGALRCSTRPASTTCTRIPMISPAISCCITAI